ncbi:MAG TPA: endonuclease MutS2 [Clostridiaceae bacterium]|nr:endonuclease MutS2 [Clostridiaceae bacterium]
MQEKTLKILEFDKIIGLLVERAMTAPGRERCSTLLPAKELTKIQAAQEETDDMVHLLLEKSDLPLSGISDIRPAVRRAESDAVLSTVELMKIGAFLRSVQRIKGTLPEDYGSGDNPDSRLVYERILLLSPLAGLESRIDECIAGEEEIRDRATVELYNIRRRIRRAQDDVRKELDRIMRSRPSALQDIVVTLRGDRYVVPVKAEHRNQIPGLVHDTSASGSTVFVEPMAVVELNNKIKVLMSEEAKEIEQILLELSTKVANQSDTLITNATVLTDLDFAQAKAKLALSMKAMPPLLNDHGRIVLKAARHPLISPAEVVPIDFELGTTFKTLVITGPNTGGKTVTLKTCGLLTLMAMAGLQIPAQDKSEVSTFNHVLADIGDEQSIEQSLSTFSSHLRQIIEITAIAEPGSLVLLDELGAGTDPSEGAALAISILEDLRSKGALTVATTHYKELKGYALNTPEVENACCEFDTDTLRPTYRLMIGVPGVSNAFAISQRLGLDPSIIARAQDLISDEGAQFEELVASIEKSHQEAKRMREEIEALRAEAKTAREELAAEEIKLEDKRQQILDQAKIEAAELYIQAEQDVEQLLAELKQKINQDAGHHIISEARGQIRQAQEKIAGQRQKDRLIRHAGQPLSADDIQPGQVYDAPALGLSGTVEGYPDNKGNVVLRSGQMQVTVPVTALTWPEKKSEPKKQRKPAAGSKENAGRITADRRYRMGTELMLLGKLVEDALLELDNYLDDATLAGLNTVRIVHGKGTGALRSAVGDFLAHDKRVSGFRLGGQGEGGDGVTIAELNL